MPRAELRYAHYLSCLPHGWMIEKGPDQSYRFSGALSMGISRVRRRSRTADLGVMNPSLLPTELP